VRVEELANFTPHKFGVEVALDATREPASVDEEFPECIGKSVAVHVGKAVHPGLPSGSIDQHQTVRVTPRRDAVPITDIHPDRVESFSRTSQATAFAAPLNVYHAANREKGFGKIYDLHAGPEGLELLVVREAATT
jgi:hypothetical protein